MSKSEERTRTSKNCKFASSSCVSYCGFTTFISTLKFLYQRKTKNVTANHSSRVLSDFKREWIRPNRYSPSFNLT